MQRRHFHKSLVAGLLTPTLFGFTATHKRLIRPPRLRPGQRVGLVSPGSYLSDEGLEKAVRQIESLGLQTRLSPHIRAERGYTAGTDAERLSDLHQMFADPDIHAIWCVRGGYGSARLLPDLDYKLIRRNPKILIGYSDITALHNAIFTKTGLVTFHGPVGASTFSDYTEKQLRQVLMEPQSTHLIPAAPPPAVEAEEDQEEVYTTYTIRAGQASGPLVGGNLSLLAAMAGTGYLPWMKGALLFIEEIGEKPYRIDRMLTTLRQNYPLQELAGIGLGIFADCTADADDRSLSLRQTLEDRLGDLGVPVCYGLPIGHIGDMCTLPVGVQARLDADRVELRLLEAGVW